MADHCNDTRKAARDVQVRRRVGGAFKTCFSQSPAPVLPLLFRWSL